MVQNLLLTAATYSDGPSCMISTFVKRRDGHLVFTKNITCSFMSNVRAPIGTPPGNQE